MARRLLILTLVVCLLTVSVVTGAQDYEEVWDLTDTFTVEDLGFEFKYPAGWFYDTSNGITLAESKADLRAAIDDDDNTQPEGTVFNLGAILINDLEGQLGKNPTLEDMADLVVELRQITEKEARIEIPVMARRTLSVFGEDNLRAGRIATLWQQGDYAVAAIMNAPNYKTAVNTAYSWGQMLGSMTPTGALELSANTVSLTRVNAEMNYPHGWYPNPDNLSVIYELKSDMRNESSEGHIIIIAEQTLDELNLGRRATAEDVAEANIKILGMEEPIRREEFILLDQPAIAIRGADVSGQYGLVVQTVVDGIAVQIAVLSPSEEAVDTFEPTFLAMLTTLYSTSS